MFLDIRLDAYYESQGESTPRTEELAPLRYDGERRRAAAIRDLLGALDGLIVLDVGCGDGYLLQCISRGCREMHGIDLASSRIAQAQERFESLGLPVHLEVADACHLPFTDASIDVVVCTEVLEHLPDPLVALCEIRRVLRPGGRTVVSVPHRELINWQRCVHCHKMTPASGHFHSFDRDVLGALMCAAGLVDLKLRGTYPRINQRGLPGRVLRAMPTSMWVHLDRFAGERMGKGNWLLCRGRKS